MLKNLRSFFARTAPIAGAALLVGAVACGGDSTATTANTVIILP